jgi:hypothetical protein
VFFKNTFKNKIIEFDSENIYFDEKAISLKNIIEIGTGKIYYTENNENKKVHFNFNYYSHNLERLRDFYKEANKEMK